jgi:hypothetical protein
MSCQYPVAPTPAGPRGHAGGVRLPLCRREPGDLWRIGRGSGKPPGDQIVGQTGIADGAQTVAHLAQQIGRRLALPPQMGIGQINEFGDPDTKPAAVIDDV